ncbi:DUF6172 family protein [Bacteriovorax sp. Seq25_V]|uniref:DUF6172 family protein n=1 Tax=Bacteriovorax sp. Seq25_V TaxID=1201288 RepID=UPI00038A2137|nr:DUF6172 family protein [Bacteriovorax sp. Seq25_V]EQC44053.1 hypothetical protein M900_1414 [Bacteriovorax sp. Seq25_V]
MKKTFQIKVDNKAPERQVDSIKHEVKKYLGRERRKSTPEGVDFWDFDCRIGDNAQVAKSIDTTEINGEITKLLEDKKESFYLEILAKPGHKQKKSS